MKEFIENGYLVVPNFFRPADLDHITNEIKQIFHTLSGKNNDLDSVLIESYARNFGDYLACATACHQLLSIQRIFMDLKIADTLMKLGMRLPALNTRPIIHFSSRKTAKKDIYWKVPAHQDWQSNQGSLNGITLWVPLVDVDEAIGPLEVASGSHLLGSLPHRDAGVPILVKDIFNYKSIPMRKGDALFFNTLLVHRSGENKTDRVRLSVATRFNDLLEPSFVKRGFPKPPPLDQRHSSAFPTAEEVKMIFKPTTTECQREALMTDGFLPN